MNGIPIGIGINIEGIQQSRNTLGRFSARMSSPEIADELRDAAEISVLRMQTAMRNTWNRGEGSGRLANSLAVQVSADEDGNATLEFTLGSFPELEFISEVGGNYHPEPYPIVAHRKYLQFFWKRMGARVKAPAVTHPGFPYDVIVDTAQQEAAFLEEAARSRFGTIVTETFSEV
jgi:hypothetical protein